MERLYNEELFAQIQRTHVPNKIKVTGVNYILFKMFPPNVTVLPYVAFSNHAYGIYH